MNGNLKGEASADNTDAGYPEPAKEQTSQAPPEPGQQREAGSSHELSRFLGNLSQRAGTVPASS